MCSPSLLLTVSYAEVFINRINHQKWKDSEHMDRRGNHFRGSVITIDHFKHPISAELDWFYYAERRDQTLRQQAMRRLCTYPHLAVHMGEQWRGTGRSRRVIADRPAGPYYFCGK